MAGNYFGARYFEKGGAQNVKPVIIIVLTVFISPLNIRRSLHEGAFTFHKKISTQKDRAVTDTILLLINDTNIYQ